MNSIAIQSFIDELSKIAAKKDDLTRSTISGASAGAAGGSILAGTYGVREYLKSKAAKKALAASAKEMKRNARVAKLTSRIALGTGAASLITATGAAAKTIKGWLKREKIKPIIEAATRYTKP